MSETGIQSLALCDAKREVSAFRPMLTVAPSYNIGTRPTTAVDDPYARGIADGQELAATVFAEERKQFLALLTAADALQPEPSEELAQLIAEAVFRLVGQVIADAPITADWLQAQAKRAADTIAECDAARTMWLHPDDIALIDGREMPLPIMADAAAERGSIRIECSAGWIEHGRSLYLDALRSALALGDAL